MSGAFVQGKLASVDATGQSSLGVTLTSNVGAGNLICGMVRYGTATSVFQSITSNQSGTVVVADTDTSSPGSNTIKTFYIYNTGSGSTTVTLNFTGANGVYPGIMALEFSGLDTTSSVLNAHQFLSQVAVGSVTDGISSGVSGATTTVDGCSVVGITINQTNVGNQTISAGTNFTLRTVGSDAGNFWKIATEDLVQSTQGAIKATFTYPSTPAADSFTTAMMAFQTPAAVVTLTKSLLVRQAVNRAGTY